MIQTDDNILITESGLEIYQSDIDYIVNDYIDSLINPEMIYKSSVFKGLLLKIYTQKIKYIIETDKHNRNTTHNNYTLLNDIFYNIYIPLVYKYNLVPTILEFCVFVNIDNSNLGDIKNGVYRGNGSKANPDHTRTVKKWYSVCESALASKAFTENSIGAIFGLKAAHNWQESKQQLEIINAAGSQATPEQIAERYKDTARPALPDAES